MRTKIFCAGFCAALLLLSSATVAGDSHEAIVEPDEQKPKKFKVVEIGDFVVCDPYYHTVERGKVGYFHVVFPKGEFDDYKIISIQFKANPRLAATVKSVNERKWKIKSNNIRKPEEREPYEKVRFIVKVQHKDTGATVRSADPIVVNE